ncbi:MAG: hypothetical protein AB7K71_09925 [Polyangiaceae bacterium]
MQTRSLFLVLILMTGCVVPVRGESPVDPSHGSLETTLESGVYLAECDGCKAGVGNRASVSYRTAPTIPIYVGVGVERSTYHFTWTDRRSPGSTAPAADVENRVVQWAVDVFGRYYLYAPPLGAPGGQAELWVESGFGYDSLSSDRADTHHCDPHAVRFMAALTLSVFDLV